MRRFLTGPVLVLSLALLSMGIVGACTDGAFDATKSDKIRGLWLTQIEQLHAAGVDPIQMSDEKVLYFSLACTTLTSLSTVIRPETPELSAEGLEWCALLADALASEGLP